MAGNRMADGLLWGLGALLCLVPDLAGAQAFPAHSVAFDPVKGLCRIVLDPAGTTGTAPARLVLSYDMMNPALSFGLDGSGIAEAVVIRQGVRQPFVGRDGMTVADLRADPVWSELDSGADGSESIYLTVKNADGGYSSARYDGLRQDDILRLAALACGVEGVDVPAQTPVEHRAAEARLALSDADRLHIRQVLATRYGAAGTEVGDAAAFTVTDRRYIAQLNEAAGYPSGEYLWPAAVPALLAEAVKIAAPAPDAAPGEAEITRSGDWVVLGDAGKGTCRITTAATTAEGVPAGLRMQFAISKDGRGGMMAIDIVTPNPFRADMPLAAVIDGQGFALQVEPKSAAVIPQPLADGSMSRDLMLALRRGKAISVQGVSTESGAAAQVSFSAIGFAAGFKAMTEACNRPGVMGWIE